MRGGRDRIVPVVRKNPIRPILVRPIPLIDVQRGDVGKWCCSCPHAVPASLLCTSAMRPKPSASSLPPRDGGEVERRASVPRRSRKSATPFAPRSTRLNSAAPTTCTIRRTRRPSTRPAATATTVAPSSARPLASSRGGRHSVGESPAKKSTSSQQLALISKAGWIALVRPR